MTMLSMSLVTTRLRMRSMHISVRPTWTRPMSTSRHVCNYFIMAVNPPACPISKTPLLRRTFTLSSIRPLAWVLRLVLNGALVVQLQCHRDQHQRPPDLLTIGIDAWQTSNLLDLSSSQLILTIIGNEAHRQPGRSVHAQSRSYTKTSSVTHRPADHPLHRPSVTWGQLPIMVRKDYHSLRSQLLNPWVQLASTTQTMLDLPLRSSTVNLLPMVPQDPYHHTVEGTALRLRFDPLPTTGHLHPAQIMDISSTSIIPTPLNRAS